MNNKLIYIDKYFLSIISASRHTDSYKKFSILVTLFLFFLSAVCRLQQYFADFVQFLKSSMTLFIAADSTRLYYAQN
ncbi:hypothetical protein F967_01610 [Acinetobacter sp. CIP 102637]|nr:hypothetical protein F967_01610 [Acinetobacter sp. CIP 102637]